MSWLSIVDVTYDVTRERRPHAVASSVSVLDSLCFHRCCVTVTGDAVLVPEKYVWEPLFSDIRCITFGDAVHVTDDEALRRRVSCFSPYIFLRLVNVRSRSSIFTECVQ